MRLIDADELLKPVGCYNPIKYTYEYGEVVTVEDIERMPTVDTELHGHWEEHPLTDEQKVCSLCGGVVESITYDVKSGAVRSNGTPYCPYCGAKMDEEIEDE